MRGLCFTNVNSLSSSHTLNAPLALSVLMPTFLLDTTRVSCINACPSTYNSFKFPTLRRLLLMICGPSVSPFNTNLSPNTMLRFCISIFDALCDSNKLPTALFAIRKT